MPLSLPCLRSGAKIRARSPLTQHHSSSTSSASPSPSPSASTNYLRYLSHLAPSDPPDSPSDPPLSPYWQFTTRCLLYLRRAHLNSPEHDALMAALFRPHFDPLRLDPTPTSPLGHALHRNGYFLAAYAYLLSRTRNTPTILHYLRETYRSYHVTIGTDELAALLHLPLPTPTPKDTPPHSPSHSSTTVKRTHCKYLGESSSW